MKIWEKTKKFYKDHKHTIIIVVSCISCFAGGYVAKDIYDNYSSKKALDEWEFKKLPNGTEIGWAGYDPEEVNKRFEEHQAKAREEYPEKFQIMEDEYWARLENPDLHVQMTLSWSADTLPILCHCYMPALVPDLPEKFASAGGDPSLLFPMEQATKQLF